MDSDHSAPTRNEYIDFLKGIAAIGIIAIHTAFWYGESYVHPWFKNLTLFLDVPFFFYLSGWGSSYRKSSITRTAKGIGSIWCKWIYFVSVLALFCYVSQWLPHPFEGVSDLRDLVNNYMFNVSFPGFKVVGGSIWFMQHYIVVVLINTVVVSQIECRGGIEYWLKGYTVALGAAFIWVIYGKTLLGLDLRYFLFYSFFWMLGRNRMGAARTHKTFFLSLSLVVFGVLLTTYLQDLPLHDIQSAKFPPSLKYGFVSMPAILIAKRFEPHMLHTNKWIRHIGRNAIFYYFAQGVGSSLNLYAVQAIQIESWIVKWIVTFLINLLVTTILAESLRKSYRFVALAAKKLLSGATPRPIS